MLGKWLRSGNHVSIFTLLLLAILLLFHADIASGTTSEPSNPSNTSSLSSTSSVSKSSPDTVPKSALISPSTCPSRTVNYLTHTLPQKCLKPNWTRHTSSGATSVDGQGSIAGSSDSVEASSLLPGSDPTGPTSATETNGTVVQDLGESLKADSSPSDSQNQESQSLPTMTTESEPAPTETETDSPLDNSKFLSFEEWKKENLEKLDQKPDDARKRSPGLEDALNEEGDIDLGFFGTSGSHEPLDGVGKRPEQTHKAPVEKATPDAPLRRKDAGTTCKERFNYASTDCAATVLKTNSKCKSPSAILVENKDSYMLNECSIDNKFLIVELCENILIDTVVLANFEYFSSMFRTFRVSISDRYPVKADRWTDLGIFTARNSRDIQAFAVENPLIWAKYLRVEFLTQYGNEFYCPVSLLRIHGTTMIEDLRPHEDAGKDEDEIEVAVASPVPVATTKEPEVDRQIMSEQTLTKGTAEQSLVHSQNEQSAGSTVGSNQQPVSVLSDESSQFQTIPSSVTVLSNNDIAASTETLISSNSSVSGSQASIGDSKPSDVSSTSILSSTPSPATAPDSTSKTVIDSSKITSDMDAKSNSPSTASPSSEAKKAQSPPDSAKHPPTIPQPPTPSPTTQESFFKSVHKRLQVLEANATLSLQYIEQQSRILRDAFTTVEKRQMSKTEDFLRHLNSSVMTELKNFRQQYDQLWQSTVLELESHREQYQREILAVSTRLTILADEVVWQKRMAVAQSFLLLLCLFLVIFGRSGSNHLELPLMQHVINKSHSMLHFPLESAPGSPSSKDNSPGRSGRLLVRHQSSGLSSDDVPLRSSRSPSLSPTYDDESLTATPNTDFSPALSKNDMDGDGSPLVDERVRALRRGERSRSGPATPRGTRDQEPLMWSMESGKSSFASSRSSIDDETDIGNTNGNMQIHSRTGSPTVRFRSSRLANGTDQEDTTAGANFSTLSEQSMEGEG